MLFHVSLHLGANIVNTLMVFHVNLGGPPIQLVVLHVNLGVPLCQRCNNPCNLVIVDNSIVKVYCQINESNDEPICPPVACSRCVEIYPPLYKQWLWASYFLFTQLPNSYCYIPHHHQYLTICLPLHIDHHVCCNVFLVLSISKLIVIYFPVWITGSGCAPASPSALVLESTVLWASHLIDCGADMRP